ncbi:MAG: hypothetical protein WBM44_17525 [Waterburya sp.]
MAEYEEFNCDFEGFVIFKNGEVLDSREGSICYRLDNIIENSAKSYDEVLAEIKDDANLQMVLGLHFSEGDPDDGSIKWKLNRDLKAVQ